MSRRHARVGAIAAGLVVLSAASAGGPAAERGPEPLPAGRALYVASCAPCHGATGSGDGPAAPALRVRPPDLTRLGERNGGAFPVERVTRIVDGRSELAPHGSRQMPIWGLSFQELDRDTNQEAEVGETLRRLVRYLESIQRRSE